MRKTTGVLSKARNGSTGALFERRWPYYTVMMQGYITLAITYADFICSTVNFTKVKAKL